MKIILLICLLFIAVHSKVTPSPNFNLTDFPGTWNLVGLYGLQSENMSSYSCATLNVTVQGALSIVTLNQSWIESTTNSFVNKLDTLIPSPLNNAILVSTTSPTPQNNYVVAYYNSTTRHAILINQAATVAFVLSGDDSYNAAHLFFIITASSVLTENGIDFSSVLEISNLNCDYGKLVPLAGFNISSIVGKKYFANVIFTEEGSIDKDGLCSTVEFSVDGDFLSLNYTKDDSADNETVLPYPDIPAVLIDTAISYSDPLVITYQDTENDVIMVFREPVAIGLSRKTSMSSVIASSIVRALENQGFSVDASNFAAIPSSCYQAKAFIA